MKFAVISDVHGNLDALEAVLADIDGAGLKDVYSLGDNIGYGPQPEEVLHRLWEKNIPSVLGNHELAVVEPKRLGWFNPVARKSLLKTAEMMSPAARMRISRWPRYRVNHGLRFVHGFPPDSAYTYHFEIDPQGKLQELARSKEWLCFIGHTHDLTLIASDGEHLREEDLDRGLTALDTRNRYMICVGSVGQPRDGNKNAKYVSVDTETATIDVRFVEYDIDRVARKIIAAGLPKVHANRLYG